MENALKVFAFVIVLTISSLAALILLFYIKHLLNKLVDFIKDHKKKTYRVVYITSKEYDNRTDNTRVIFAKNNSQYGYFTARSIAGAIVKLYKKEHYYDFLITQIEEAKGI